MYTWVSWKGFGWNCYAVTLWQCASMVLIFVQASFPIPPHDTTRRAPCYAPTQRHTPVDPQHTLWYPAIPHPGTTAYPRVPWSTPNPVIVQHTREIMSHGKACWFSEEISIWAYQHEHDHKHEHVSTWAYEHMSRAISSVIDSLLRCCNNADRLWTASTSKLLSNVPGWAL